MQRSFKKKHRCRIRRTEIEKLWKVQCYSCALTVFGVHYFTDWNRALTFSLKHYQVYTR